MSDQSAHTKSFYSCGYFAVDISMCSLKNAWNDKEYQIEYTFNYVILFALNEMHVMCAL